MKILLIEDEPSHARLIEIVLRHAGIENDILKIGNGTEALEYLTSRGRYAGHDVPADLLVLLDLNLPGATGHEILERLRSDGDARRNIPVIVVTSSDDPEEMDRCYALGCNGYLVKPPEEGAFLDAFHKAGLM